ncbi:hypothetical protein D3C85_720040 [compost metagenome]
MRALATDVQQRHQQAGKQDADRIQPPQKRHGDRRIAVARRDLRHQLTDRPGDFTHTGKPGQAAADQQREPDQALLAKADETGGTLVQPEHFDLETDKAFLQQHPHRHQREQGEVNPGVDPAIVHQQRQAAGVTEHR